MRRSDFGGAGQHPRHPIVQGIERAFDGLAPRRRAVQRRHVFDHHHLRPQLAHQPQVVPPQAGVCGVDPCLFASRRKVGAWKSAADTVYWSDLLCRQRRYIREARHTGPVALQYLTAVRVGFAVGYDLGVQGCGDCRIEGAHS